MPEFTPPPPMEYPSAITDAVKRHVRLVTMRIEKACESAIQGGKHGVMIEGDHAWVDSRVPYGQKWDVTACGADNVERAPGWDVPGEPDA